MTGFGSATVAEDGLIARTEIRSVNHRYLQVKVRMPIDDSALEPEVEALVRKALSRGAVTVTVHVEHEAKPAAVKLDVKLARHYQAALNELANELDLGRKVELDTLIALPGVVSRADDARERERERKAVLESVKTALADLGKMRSAEGQSLVADLKKHTAAIEKVVAKIEKRMPKVVKEHHAAIVKRVNELLDGHAAVALSDLPRELALLADRMDVSEELARLKSHLEQWETLLAKGQAVGRQLDFLVQELLREANTIGAKCNDATMAHAVVELKTLIERLREQVQNVE
jgi:uncharacterized protein (TIGR00255 family)